MINRSVSFGSKQFDFELQFSERKTLGITVKANLELVVRAPENTPIEKIEGRIKTKALWIIKQQNHFKSLLPVPSEKKYVSGESHFYLGNQYRLEIILGNKNEVHYKGRFIQIITKKRNNANVLLRQWYRSSAKEKFIQLAEPIIEKFKIFDVTPSAIAVLDMPKRWGSCTPRGKIILNPNLIKVPKLCIEYVIIHEMCHLVHHNHTKSFYTLLETMCPDWEKRKRKLEKF